MPAWGKYEKRYRKEWEKEAKFKEWIQPMVGQETKAMCKLCKSDIRAHRADLAQHANTAKHKRNSQRCSSVRLTNLGVSRTARGVGTGTKEQELNTTSNLNIIVDSGKEPLYLDGLDILHKEINSEDEQNFVAYLSDKDSNASAAAGECPKPQNPESAARALLQRSSVATNSPALTKRRSKRRLSEIQENTQLRKEVLKDINEDKKNEPTYKFFDAMAGEAVKLPPIVRMELQGEILNLVLEKMKTCHN